MLYYCTEHICCFSICIHACSCNHFFLPPSYTALRASTFAFKFVSGIFPINMHGMCPVKFTFLKPRSQGITVI